MEKVLLALALAAAGPAARAAPAARAPAAAAPLSDDERAFCASELGVVERRAHLFAEQGLAEAEIARRNASQLQALADCRRRFTGEQRRLAEEREDLEELDRRAGPTATELERERAWRQIRRERLASRNPASLTPEERAELQAGLGEEVAATHQTLDSAHARDRTFMRQVHSALSCYHGERKAELRESISHEESLVKLGTGDKTRLYALRSQLRESEDVLARSREAAKGYPDGLARCTEPQTAVLAHCLGIRFEAKQAEPACESEEIQQYIRFIK